MNMIRSVWDMFFRGWMRFAHILGVINTTILLTIVYVVVVLPTRFIWWIVRKDPLALRRSSSTTMWIQRGPDEPSLDERRHPF